MSVEECITEYTDLSEKVFTKKTRRFIDIKGNVQERYDSDRLASEVKRIATE